jgi:phage gpG-like protein
VIITSDKPYAQIHNEGGEAKIFGKKVYRMPKRQFIGPSYELDEKILKKIDYEIMKIFNNINILNATISKNNFKSTTLVAILLI